MSLTQRRSIAAAVVLAMTALALAWSSAGAWELAGLILLVTLAWLLAHAPLLR